MRDKRVVRMAYLFGQKVKKSDFWERSIPVNRILLRICAAFSLLIEIGNMVRVLFFSGAALGTQNNRIYFGFYLFFAVACAVFLVLDFGLKRLPDKIRHCFYMAAGSVFLLWNTLFNIYDIHRAGAVGNFTIVTAVMAFSSLFVMRPGYLVGNLAVNYLLFAGFLYSRFSSGEVINFTITILLCVLIGFVRYRNVGIALSREAELDTMHWQLLETQQSLQLSAEQYELIRKSGKYVTFQWNIRGDSIRFSKEMADWFDTPEEIVRFEAYIRDSKAIAPESRSRLLACMRSMKDTAVFQREKLLLPMKNGKTGWFEIWAAVQTDRQGRPSIGIGWLTDITTQVERFNHLEENIRLDLFTGVYNKAEIERYGQRVLRELDEGEVLAAFILDIDDFKNINDHYGHPVGDYVLKNIAKLMQQELPKGGHVGRIGGDEFLALARTDDVDGFCCYAERLVKKVAGIRWQGKALGTSCSIGLFIADADTSYPELYAKADEALRRAKAAGKKQVQIYSAAVHGKRGTN